MLTNAEKPAGPIKRVRRKAPVAETASPPRAVSSVSVEVSATPPPSASRLAGGSVRHSDITMFLRQLIMLLEAGTPILKSLRSLSERGEKAAQRSLVADIAQHVEMGNPLWQAFERHPRYFDVVFVNLIKASEASGTLVTVLQRVVGNRDRKEALRKRVRGAMFYPVILLLACFGAIIFIARVVIPEFEDMFSKFNVEMPALTRYFMAAAKIAGTFWWLGILAIVAAAVAYKYWYVRNPLRRLTADRLKLRIPILGSILRKTAIVELCRTLALLLRSGLSMMATLELVRNAITNRAVAQTLQSMRDSVERGEGLEAPLRASSDIIPPIVTDMLVTGEESGRLDSIAEQIADTYEEDVNIAIATIGDALQPILTVFIGVLVILLMLAVFVPLITMIDQLGASGA